MPLLCCQVCGRACDADSDPSCPKCRVLFYCSTQHLQLHTSHSHGPEECSRMAAQLQRGQVLSEHHMPWHVQSVEQACAWLSGLSCHDGLLLRCRQLHPDSCTQRQQECSSPNSNNSSAQHAWLPETQEQWHQAWGAADTGLVPPWLAVQQQQADQLQAAACWRQYYDLRGLPHTSPAALVLHSVLTLWHCLVHLLPEHAWPLPPKGHTIRVAYLGPRGEMSLLPAFAELALLLPGHSLDLHFIGPDVPEELHQKTCCISPGQQQSQPQQQEHTGVLQVSCWVGCWHDVLADWAHGDSGAHLATCYEASAADSHQQWSAAAVPAAGSSFHLVFAANAGLPAYASWVPSLQQLVQLAPDSHGGTAAGGSASAATDRVGVPVVFSDYCEEAACMSQQLVQHLVGRAFSLSCCLNPFRDPVPAVAHGTRLPACSNGFLFGWL